MGLFSYYMRRFVRSHFRPIHPIIAKRWETRTSILYLCSAWTLFGYAVYSFTIENKDSDNKFTGRAFTPYESMRKLSMTSADPTLITVRGTTIEREVLTLEEVTEKSR